LAEDVARAISEGIAKITRQLTTLIRHEEALPQAGGHDADGHSNSGHGHSGGGHGGGGHH
jgi:hypothetical protein